MTSTSDSKEETSATKTKSKKKSRGKWCCVPFCENGFYTKSGDNSKISFFHFPVEPEEKKNKWLKLIKREEKKKPDFFLSKQVDVHM